MSIYYEPGTEGLTDSTHHLQAALEAVAATARKLKEERDEAREKIERQAERIRYLEGATNHATGTPLSVALKERDEARSVIRMLWELAETHLDLSDEELDRVNRSWGESAK